MTNAKLLRGPLLNPLAPGRVQFVPDGLLECDASGRIAFAGEAARHPGAASAARSLGVMMPPFLDNHIHIPQHPIRGRFTEGIDANPPEGRLLAGLYRNVFPAEGRCERPSVAKQVVEDFLADTLSQGVVGGAAYMTVHTRATEVALEKLPDSWHVGLVLMNDWCPEYLRTDEASLEQDVERLVKRFGRRVIVTDRFAAAVTSPLRQRGVALAKRFGLRMQTHLAEQIKEKAFVESLYPDAAHYTDVYARDGLLDCGTILAHCIRMSDAEFDMICQHAANIAHCPTSNVLLGSGIMPLDAVVDRGIPYAICTDVGASPTTSILCELVQFLRMHAGRSLLATPQEGLYRVTLGAARMLGLEQELGSFEVGKPFSLVEVACDRSLSGLSADEAILALLEMTPADLAAWAESNREPLNELQASGLDQGPALARLTEAVRETVERLNTKVLRVIVAGQELFYREHPQPDDRRPS